MLDKPALKVQSFLYKAKTIVLLYFQIALVY